MCFTTKYQLLFIVDDEPGTSIPTTVLTAIIVIAHDEKMKTPTLSMNNIFH